MLILGTLCGLLINLEQAQIKARFPFMPIFVFFFTRFLTLDSSLLKIFSILWVRVNSINKVSDNWISHRLEGENRMEWKLMKKIILEYFSIPFFESFNGGNAFIWEFKWKRMKWVKREHSFLFIFLKSQIFISPEIGKNEKEWS